MPRYLVGIVPVMLGWPTLLLPGQLALAAQWAAFTGVWFMDSRVTARGWTPKWYSTYRFALSIVVGTCIILTLGVTNYYQSGSIGSAAAKLAKIKSTTSATKESTDTEKAAGPKFEGTVAGDFATTGGDDAYVKFENVEKKREEETKAKEEEDQKEREQAEGKAKEAKEKATQKAEAARDKAEGKV